MHAITPHDANNHYLRSPQVVTAELQKPETAAMTGGNSSHPSISLMSLCSTHILDLAFLHQLAAQAHRWQVHREAYYESSIVSGCAELFGMAKRGRDETPISELLESNKNNQIARAKSLCKQTVRDFALVKAYHCSTLNSTTARVWR